jgi:type II secretory pathway component PulJ
MPHFNQLLQITNMKKITGLTLIELIATIVLLSIVAIISSRILATGLTAYLTSENILDASAQARLGVERMVRDIRAVRSSTDISTASASQFTFTDSNGNSISYLRSGTTLTRNGQVLADGVSALTFTYADKNGAATATLANIRYITPTLTITQGNTNFSIDTTVYPRNLP